MKVGLLKTTLVNYPGRVASAVFLPGCNLRCPFCHNAALATASVVSGPHQSGDDDNEYVTIEEVYAHLEKRAHVLGALAISGGEPLLSPALSALVAKARSLGLDVKIDTNGTLADRLQTILDDPTLRPDMLAVDVKTSPSRYGELETERSANNAAGSALLRSLAVLERERVLAETEFPAHRKKLRVEFRTVLVPGLVGESELREIAALLPQDADWQLAPFMGGVCLDPAWNTLAPYGPEETKRLVAIAQGIRSGARFR